MPGFHEVRFPIEIALGARGGPERRTEIVTTATGREERNARWALSRRRYDAGYGVRSIEGLSAIVAFFEERRGRLHGFRFRDRLDWTSASRNAPPAPLDQVIGIGDGVQTAFHLIKLYGANFAPYKRPIAKPVQGSVRIAVGGIERTSGLHFNCDPTTGIITFLAGHIPASGATVTAGFAFDVPVRFDTDFLEIDLSAFEAGAIPSIPLIEIRS
ncbi:MAG: phage distal tail protein, Rcc01695 family [Rhabdaerophilum sp.]